MRNKLAMAGFLAVTACAVPACRDAGNRINNFTADGRIMAEPAMKKQKPSEQPTEPSTLKDVRPQPVEKKEPKYKSEPDFVFGNGDKFYEDKKLGLGRVIRSDGDLVIEGRVVKNDGKGNVEIETNPQDKKYDIRFRPDGFRITIPHLLKD